LGASYEPVLDGRCSLGILAALPALTFPSLASERLGEVPLVAVASANHPLARFARQRVPRRELAKHVQLVLTDRSNLMAGRDHGVVSRSTWRLADLSTKYAFLKDGVGWGGMPLHMVAQDVAGGALVVLDVDEMPATGFMLAMSAVYPAAAPPGPAGRWFMDQMKMNSLANA
jgi:DNA-binding transcriptional LysR family regulator